MAGIFRLRFSGHLDRGAFEAALRNAVQRHPLLRATIDRTRKGRPRWIDHPDWRPEVQWQAETNDYGFPSATYIDLTQEPGTRAWVVDREDGHDVVLQSHHCCADALGMSKVFEDLLIGYAIDQGSAEENVSLPSLDPQRLIGRGTPGLTTWNFLKMAHKQAVGLLGARQFLMRSPVPLARRVDDIDEMSPPPTFPSPHTYDLDPSETKGLVTAAKSQSVTVNDLLARDLFLALGTWRENRAIGGDRDWLRFSIPMNLRTAVDDSMPMANSVSMVFLDRQPCSFSDPGQLLKSIHDEMGLIKRLRLKYTFILSLGLSRSLPGGLSRTTSANKCHSTSCLSNLGPVLARTPLPRRDGRIVSGNVVLETVDYVIPLRPQLNAAFFVHTYAGRLRVLMHCDPRVIAGSHSGDLLETYIRQIRRTIDDGHRLS
jgi:NRPS condensation-like uncharacterized protein